MHMAIVLTLFIKYIILWVPAIRVIACISCYIEEDWKQYVSVNIKYIVNLKVLT